MPESAARIGLVNARASSSRATLYRPSSFMPHIQRRAFHRRPAGDLAIRALGQPRSLWILKSVFGSMLLNSAHDPAKFSPAVGRQASARPIVGDRRGQEVNPAASRNHGAQLFFTKGAPEMMKRTATMATTSRITVKVGHPASRDQQLDQTCAVLRGEARDCGILVTRIDHTTFEVALSPDVEFGLTRELDLL